ncbi:hypothetical protein IQ268_09770 [Oculatella sp. LEGE 06141]|uniref:hypothetical protein n=1 Tax=Oculatella sp. LEGE 06141 TaxID=1828648 RepID=UPI001881FBC3|nr:hypothetical protein [Oculatella sp. LEGE 06141]MBE9178846.1 hypothetical protein [Oculatella sp. LEGE 06141]
MTQKGMPGRSPPRQTTALNAPWFHPDDMQLDRNNDPSAWSLLKTAQGCRFSPV